MYVADVATNNVLNQPKRTLRDFERDVLVSATVWYFRDDLPDDNGAIEERLRQAVAGYLHKFRQVEQSVPAEDRLRLLQAMFGTEVGR